MTLDMKTVMFAGIIVNVVGLIVLLMLWYQNRNKYPGIFFWIMDWFLQVGGGLLVALRGTIPDWASMILSNSMIIGGTLMLYFGLCRFAGKKNHPAVKYIVLILFAVFICIHTYFVYGNDALLVRSYNTSTGLILGCMLSMWLLLKGVSPEIRRISTGTGVSFGIIIVISLGRILGFSLITQTSNDFLKSGMVDTFLMLLLIGAIGFLVFNLVLMVNKRLYLESKQLEKTATQNAIELQTTFNTTTVGFVLLVNRVVKQVNNAVCQMLGYSREEMIGKNTRLFYRTEEEYQSLASVYPRIAELGSLSTEIRLLRKDGGMVDAIMSISALDKKDLTAGVILSLLDITERKKTEQIIKNSLKEKETLLKEVHHRVKNNMQIISSLLHLQAGEVKDPKVIEMLKDSQNRIQSMALVYNKLYQSQNLASINMADYINEIVGGLIKSYTSELNRITARVDVADVFLGVDTAIPCSLIINELVTNSLKHAFPKNRTGEIIITLKEGIHRELEVVVSDNGVGIPTDLNKPESGVFGLKLVTNLVHDQLNGKIEIDHVQGTVFKISFRRPEEEK